MEFVYKFINEQQFDAIQVDDDYQLQANETFEAPESGLYMPYKFQGGKIVGATFEQAQAFLGAPEPEQVIDTAVDQSSQVLDLTNQIAQQQADFAAYREANDAIVQQLLAQSQEQKDGDQ